jgi:hypothetical protein
MMQNNQEKERMMKWTLRVPEQSILYSAMWYSDNCKDGITYDMMEGSGRRIVDDDDDDDQGD